MRYLVLSDIHANLEALEAYVRTPETGTTVVFVADAFDKRRKLSKALLQHAVLIECGSLADEHDALHWIRARVGEQGMTIEAAAARFLVQRAGLDVARLRAEIERVCLFASGRPAVTAADVAEVAGAATSQDDWAMVNAMRAGNAALALRELSLVLGAGGVPLLILGQIRSFIESAHRPAFGPPGGGPRRSPMTADQQKRAFDVLFRMDLALKTSTGDPQILLERLIVELCEGV
jgi:DNA polymerase-3 subunit delta